MSSIRQATSPSADAARKIRVGVVGVGYLGRFHARIYNDMPDVELVGVADIDPKSAQSAAEKHSCKAYTDSVELLDQVEAVSIVVPTAAHLQVARPFL